MWSWKIDSLAEARCWISCYQLGFSPRPVDLMCEDLFTSKTSANSDPASCAAGHTVKALFCHWTGEHEQEPKLGTWGGRRLEPETGPVWLSVLRLPSFRTSVVSPPLVSMEFTGGATFKNTAETIARWSHWCADNHTERVKLQHESFHKVSRVKLENYKQFNFKLTFEMRPVNLSRMTAVGQSQNLHLLVDQQGMKL